MAYSLWFEESYLLAMKHEGHGVLTDIPEDPGKQTWSGISRAHHPDWQGWALIDAGAHRTESGREQLFALQEEFYYHNFWREIDGENLSLIDYRLVMKVFDTAVHRSPKTAVRYLQRSLNILNYDQKLYPDLKLDGVVGVKTYGALILAKQHHGVDILLNWFRCIYGSDMVSFIEYHPSREKFTGLASRALY